MERVTLLRVAGGMVRCLLLAHVSLGLLAPAALAQDDPPEPGAAASVFLPEGDGFGPGWKRFAPAAVPNVLADTFASTAMVAYGGPEGARVVLVALVAEEGRTFRAWEESTVLFETYQYNIAYDYARLEQLRNVPPPPGCAEAKRIDGPDYDDGYPTGITLCAADQGVVLLAVASGAVNDESGFAASDNVIVAALDAGATAGTPAAAGGDGGAEIALDAFDIGWSDAVVSAAAGDTLRITNTGTVAHRFVVDPLGIDVELPIAETVDVEIPADAAAGAYEFFCSVPGHQAAGMSGELTIG